MNDDLMIFFKKKGLISRDQMVGPWQIPVSNVGVTTASYTVLF